MKIETIAVPVPLGSKSSGALLRMILENAHIDPNAVCPGRGVMTILLDDWQIELLSSYGVTSEKLEGSNDDEEAAVL